VNMTFYDSLLPHIASADEVDVVSSSAYASAISAAACC